jgi:methylenetetrahydrofolate reductase (NADPH)
MKVSDILKNALSTHVSFEILPPLKGNNINAIYHTIDNLMLFNPIYVNVTYHREEIIYKQLPSGLLEKKIVHKRPGTIGISAALKYKYGIVVVPHIICGGFTAEETEEALVELNYIGINNVLALRGDVDKATGTFIPEKGGNLHALELVKQINNLNNGIYLEEDLEEKTATNFCIGVAGYPEKHNEAPNAAFDLEVLKQKVDAGAEFIVTQMFFNNDYFFRFVDNCLKAGINIPIVAGLKPISVYNHLNNIPKTFNVEIPEKLEKLIRKCKNNEDVRKLGIDWTTTQTEELIKSGVPAIHYYTMGKSDNIVSICKNCHFHIKNNP